MRFALIDNKRTDAAPDLKGICAGCQQPVISKCGTRRIWHWAHKGQRVCDQWWEPETDWHRAWKNNFPLSWQETIQFDPETNEKHIADVFTEHGLVIEFQHSHLKPEERAAREKFYKNMVWVVDGTRLKRDYPRFQQAWPHFMRLAKNGFFCVPSPDKCFPVEWLTSTTPVIFDFQGIQPDDPTDALRNTLWCLLPDRAEQYAVVVGIRKQDFVATTSSRAELLPAKEIVNGVAVNMRRQKANRLPPILLPPKYSTRRRGFRRF